MKNIFLISDLLLRVNEDIIFLENVLWLVKTVKVTHLIAVIKKIVLYN